jgi:hypothetical protein
MENKNMKRVMTTSEVTHAWAHQSQSDARNGKNTLYFQGRTIYSYGSHFVVATFVSNISGNTAVLFTTDRYSVTTAKHVGMVRRAISANQTVFNVPLENTFQQYRDVSTDGTLVNPSSFIRSYQDRIEAYSRLVARSRGVNIREHYYSTLVELVSEANQYCEFFMLPDRFIVPDDFDALKQELQRIDAQKRRDTIERNRKIEADNAFRIERWIAGDAITLPYNLETTFLRIEGDQMVTSRGVKVPLTHAVALLAVVRRCVERQSEFVRNGHNIRIGVYHVDRISTDGDLTAGCHFIKYAEIERIGAIIDGMQGGN